MSQKQSQKPEGAEATTPYGSFRTMTSFVNDYREQKHIPHRIDRSEMSKLSGSARNETLSTLRYFGLVEGPNDKPNELFEQYVMASDEERKPMLAAILRKSYSFLFDTADFDITRATQAQMTELFRSRGVSGSTLVRAVSLFNAAAKEAGITVSPSAAKTPTRVRTPNSTRKKVDKKPAETGTGEAKLRDERPGLTHRFELPIPGKAAVVVIVPTDMDAADWDMLSQMFGIYVARWKGYTPTTTPATPAA